MYMRQGKKKGTQTEMHMNINKNYQSILYSLSQSYLKL